MAKWTRERCHDDLMAFIKTSDDLRDASWGKFAKTHSAASSGIVAKYLGATIAVAAIGSTGDAEGATFSRLVCEYAEKFSEPTRVHRWPLCPKWVRHGATEEDPITGWLGTVTEHASRACKRCDQLAARRAEWQKANPWVDYHCIKCDRVTPWSPNVGGEPVCERCHFTRGEAPGRIVPYKGGGEPVRFEKELSSALRALGLHALDDHGVVLRESAWVRHVIKPDIVLPKEQIAIEYDVEGRIGRHATDEGEKQDRERDRVLGEHGWRVLRVRPADDATDWPWSIATRTQSARKLAQILFDEITKATQSGTARTYRQLGDRQP